MGTKRCTNTHDLRVLRYGRKKSLIRSSLDHERAFHSIRATLQKHIFSFIQSIKLMTTTIRHGSLTSFFFFRPLLVPFPEMPRPAFYANYPTKIEVGQKGAGNRAFLDKSRFEISGNLNLIGSCLFEARSIQSMPHDISVTESYTTVPKSKSCFVEYGVAGSKACRKRTKSRMKRSLRNFRVSKPGLFLSLTP